MKLFLSTLLAATLAALFFPATADTTTFRCRNDLVNVGDGKASALLKCGEPVVKDSFCKPVEAIVADSSLPTAPGRPAPTSATTTVIVAGCTTVDEWTYNPGFGQFMTTLRFESGRLTNIRYGDRVK